MLRNPAQHDILRDNHLEKEGGKRLFRMGQGDTKRYLKQFFEDINGCSKYGRDMVNQLREDTLDRNYGGI